MAARQPSQTLLIAGIGFALVCFVILNMVMQRLDPKYQEQLQKEREQKAAMEAAKKAEGKPTTVATAGGGDLVALGQDMVLGNKDGKKEVVVGWEWTPDVQADPGKVYNAIDRIRTELPDVKIRVVNVDENPTVTEGVSLGTTTFARPKEDGTLEIDQDVINRIKDAAGVASPAAPSKMVPVPTQPATPEKAAPKP